MDKFRLFIARFKEHMESMSFSQRTVETYLYHLKFFLNYLNSSSITKLTQITKQTILDYQMSLFTQEKPISLETQGARLVALKSFFRYLLRTNQTLYNPTQDVELPKRKKNLPKDIMTKKEVFKLLNQPNPDTALGLRDKAILELLYSTAIRNQELRRLNVLDIDTINLDLRVNQGKGKKDRVIPVGEVCAGYVDEYIKHARGKLLNGKENNLLFVTINGLGINHANLIWLVKKYTKRAKIKKNITPHSLRHTCATHLLKNGASLRHIQKLLGHGSIETTQIYTRIEVSDLKKAHKRYHPRERG